MPRDRGTEESERVYHQRPKFDWTPKELIVLVLTRKIGESLMIGDEVTVTILDVKGPQVRIGVNAPKDVAVYREEIFDRIQKEKAQQLE